MLIACKSMTRIDKLKKLLEKNHDFKKLKIKDIALDRAEWLSSIQVAWPKLIELMINKAVPNG